MKGLIGLPLAYATYTVFTCPCDKIPNCHLSSVWKALGVAAGFLVLENGLTFHGENEVSAFGWPSGLGGALSVPGNMGGLTDGAASQSFTQSQDILKAGAGKV